jgi:peroxiredoxin (alkyl hydroperoxide reductase subunit C)
MRYLILIALVFFAACTATHTASQQPPSVLLGNIESVPTLVTKEAPDFTSKAVMPDNSFQDITLSSFRGKYVILFLYPMDFTFVCPTEIITFDKMLQEFKKRNCEIIGASTDSQFVHLAWKNTPVEEGGIGQIQYPLVSDTTREISRLYGVLHDEGVALRGLFLIDKEGKVRHELVNDFSLGRSIKEALRTLQALQIVDEYGELCPAEWHPGEETIKQPKTGSKEK